MNPTMRIYLRVQNLGHPTDTVVNQNNAIEPTSNRCSRAHQEEESETIKITEEGKLLVQKQSKSTCCKEKRRSIIGRRGEEKQPPGVSVINKERKSKLYSYSDGDATCTPSLGG
ncbi:hypothetical protein [Oryza sativa Japonica Group]|uniref:Uncharacterized protein n=1 Tax=Oryza sativa subsp. japonica TaxID=39947 RepID=Q5N7T5_ORYSJ|nr:hypothetical protein [Oryza sativa Japonica Group]